MNRKKLLRKFALYLLTSGASLILGFLSFGGMFALWPVLPLAFTAFVLSVAYEGEIYLQNITGSWNKLFKFKYLERQLAKQFLSEHFPDTDAKDCPTFFKDYDIQLQRVHAFGDKPLTLASKKLKKYEEKTLADMEKWFSLMLFSGETQGVAPYAKAITTWIKQQQNPSKEDIVAKKNRDTNNVWRMKGFSALAGVFMSVGTSYLLIEAFSAIPFFATIPFSTWPLFIIPMAAIAGAAYGLLTYNTITEMYNNETLTKWLKNLSPQENVKKTALAYCLVTLALVLTICTAGTWWTVIKETRPLFGWMEKLPRFIMGVINPLITGLSAVIFNLENTHQSLEWIMPTPSKEKVVESHKPMTGHSAHMKTPRRTKKEHFLQKMNPFRFILMLTITPLRLVLFAGHLISIGVTADRLPGVSTLFSAVIGIISEGFEDFHYFFSHGEVFEDFHYFLHQYDEIGHQHDSACNHHHEQASEVQQLRDARLKKGHGHDHSHDIPTQVIKGLLTPIYYLAALWDCLSSKLNQDPACHNNFTEAKKKMGFKTEEETTIVPSEALTCSPEWMLAHAIQRIQRHKEKRSDINKPLLDDLEKDLCNITELPTPVMLSGQIASAIDRAHSHQFFTTTQQFLQKELPLRLNLPVPAGGS